MSGPMKKGRSGTMSAVAGQPGKIQEGNLFYLNATAKLVCQLDASRRQLDQLEAHADRILRSAGAA